MVVSHNIVYGFLSCQ